MYSMMKNYTAIYVGQHREVELIHKAYKYMWNGGQNSRYAGGQIMG